MTQPAPQPEPPNTPDESSNLSATFGAPPPPPPAQSTAGPVWFQRLSMFILVLFCIYLGAIITALPWWTSIWDRNAWLLAHPHLRAVLLLGPVRGIVSGLGVLDIWIGISEALTYRDLRTPPPAQP